ncbi:nervana 2 [Carabus blaptoides fortunei]
MATPGKESENGVYEFPYMRPESHLTNWEKFQLAVWNSSENKFLGRDAKSWGQILMFYSVFYVVLGALFAICVQGLFLTLDEEKPMWLLDESLIGTNPGLGFRPISNRTEEGSLIWYDAKNSTSIQKWTELLDEYLELYLDSSKLEGSVRNQVICSFGNKPSAEKACAVEVDKWGPCSPENGYGYNKSQPCFFLKLNRIYGWEADYYNDPKNLPTDMPQDLKEHIGNLTVEQRNQTWVSCAGENPADRETLGDTLRYYPTRGFPNYYYPYTNVKGYLSPLVAVQVVRPKTNILINIECRAWAKNIIYRGGNQQREGSVHLELLVD